ncbi:hypothetical protein [Vibrio metschnikovii]|uniref:Uncharacterized protein n=1 Tax=Vibrio metschnikovii TaxID=28172 RepID=A0A9X0RB86_VIBME|nr:hypothetical protein [Vibrio metschnikovii]MBC5853229.1 hypothetical protein [Vibrio metschnikovii]
MITMNEYFASVQHQADKTTDLLDKPVVEMTFSEIHQRTAYRNGFSIGNQQGISTGYQTAIDNMKPAISDGLRHGSPECGRVMQGF